MRRRAFLGAVGSVSVATLAGCLDFIPQSETIIDQNNRRVPEGGYMWWEFELNNSSELTLSTAVREGPSVDILLLTAEEFRSYEANQRYRPPVISQRDTVGKTTNQTVSSGEYSLIIDNIFISSGQPPGSSQDNTAVIDVTLHAEN